MGKRMETNVDYRLDLFNAVGKFIDKMDNKNDGLFLISKSSHGDNFSACLGNTDMLEFMLSDASTLECLKGEQIENYRSMQNFILNAAFAILQKNEQKRIFFIESFK